MKSSLTIVGESFLEVFSHTASESVDPSNSAKGARWCMGIPVREGALAARLLRGGGGGGGVAKGRLRQGHRRQSGVLCSPARPPPAEAGVGCGGVGETLALPHVLRKRAQPRAVHWSCQMINEKLATPETSL